METKTSILVIYTGGTIGMMAHPETGALSPLNFNEITRYLPELKRFDFKIDSISFTPPLDSSDIGPDIWIKLANLIEEKYTAYDGFVILHGTDTMAYTASALSFAFENLTKPVILTGSQIPLGVLRTDGKENIITALEIAATKRNDKPLISEVCIYFENKLFRGNRTHKHNAEYFNAFRSDNFPPLAEAGIHINFNLSLIPVPDFSKPLVVHKEFDTNVAVLKIFPGISKKVIESVLQINNLKGVILETFGEGNTITTDWFIKLLEQALDNDIIILNVSQCAAGKVDQGKYQTSKKLLDIGVINGFDITTEASITKLMHLFGCYQEINEIKVLVNKPIRGEISL